MTGSKTNGMTRSDVLAAIRNIPSDRHFVWDGIDEDDRPATADELDQATAAYTRSRGRPAGTALKQQVTVRLDKDLVASLRASGTGWQTRMNDLLRKALGI